MRTKHTGVHRLLGEVRLIRGKHISQRCRNGAVLIASGDGFMNNSALTRAICKSLSSLNASR